MEFPEKNHANEPPGGAFGLGCWGFLGPVLERGSMEKNPTVTLRKRFSDEEELSDVWANGVNVDDIDVVQMNESPTAPELRFIHSKLGTMKGKKILDIGCGLGEASVYFARRGAKVSAMDLSGAMLSVAQKLAKKIVEGFSYNELFEKNRDAARKLITEAVKETDLTVLPDEPLCADSFQRVPRQQQASQVTEVNRRADIEILCANGLKPSVLIDVTMTSPVGSEGADRKYDRVGCKASQREKEKYQNYSKEFAIEDTAKAHIFFFGVETMGAIRRGGERLRGQFEFDGYRFVR